MHDKLIFVVLDESTLPDIGPTIFRYSSWKSRNTLRHLFVRLSTLFHVRQLATALLKQLTMLLGLLRSTETLSVFYCLLLQNT